MSFFPSPLGRRQELKLWQGNYDSLLQNKSKNSTSPSDFETIEGLSALDSTRSSPTGSLDRNEAVDWDKKTISPSKPFEQLLEEQLAEDKPVPVTAKPKKPFLRKGAGLTRYKLNQRKNSVTRKPPSNETIKKGEQGSKKQSVNAPVKRKSCLKSANNNKEPIIDLTPLKMPDMVIQPKASWHKVLEQSKENNATEKPKQEDDVKPPKNNFNSHIIGKINEFALKHFLPHNPKKSIFSKNCTNSFHAVDDHNDSSTSENKSAYEGTTENELRIFEALEERIENSSFSSTNSSIMRLLCSTPNKTNKAPSKSPIPEEKTNYIKNSKENVHRVERSLNLHQKLQEVNKKTDVLHEFLKSLRKMGGNSDSKRRSKESLESVNEKSLKGNADSSFEDDEKWSSNTDGDSRSPTPLSFYTDFENSFRGDNVKKVDAAVNTTLSDKEETMLNEKCSNCEELEKKLGKLRNEVPDIKEEKARVCDFAKELEKKRDQIAMEMQMLRKNHEAQMSEIREEFDTEKKKFAREKMVFDTYIKDSQNRPNRKEREETSNLKKELIDVKELLKLKETKNGATQARLRNQIKQLEKDNSELKVDIEKLRKENAKLTASQKVRTPSEVKMLHEINKNLTKLTEETFKKQVNKPETNSDTSNQDLKRTKSGRKSREKENDEKEKEISPTVKKKHSSVLKNRLSDDVSVQNSINDSCGHDITNFANLSLEKQYENVFGQFPSPGPSNNSFNDSKKEKTETIYEDGSKEIRYSNGNTKTISPDHNLIIVKYYNGDIKETNLLECTLKYYYAENGTWHTQFGDGSELLEYTNGQRERRYRDGKREIKCADGSFITRLPDGTEEVVYPDGSKLIKDLEGDRILLLPNGQKEIHTKEHKRREYPDGTVKILYPDGIQETRYSSGRVRVKNSNGVLIMDSQNSD